MARIMVQLGKLQSLGQLADLFHSLGYTRHLEQVESGTWCVGRWRGYRVLAANSAAPDRAAVRLAKAMTSRSQRSLAVGISPGREIAIVAPRIGVPGVTRNLSILIDAPTAFELHKLELLRPAEDANALAHSLRVAEVLDSEPPGDRFFTAFRAILERMVASRRDIPEGDGRSLVLLALTRVLFLYFVQSKGWLDGKLQYLRGLFDESLRRRKHFHREVLDPLFFGSLNVPRHLRKPGAVAPVPYLNGGLFERRSVERRWPDFHLTNENWRDAFDELFERFQFHIGEHGGLDSIAPDMLGRVFERLGETDRHRTGTFYTPEIIVRQIVDATLESALVGRDGIDSGRAAQCVAGTPDPGDRATLRSFLGTLRLLDPAVGSGAFLLGALDSLTRMWRAVAPGEPSRSIKARVIRDNLFGVDQSPAAVRLAELRLWLALIADDRTEAIERVEPLPNLNGVVRRGDSLIDPLVGHSRVDDGAVERVRLARESVFGARGPSLTARLGNLRSAEHDLAVRLLQKAIDSTKRRLSEYQDLAATRDLFGKSRALSVAERREVERLRTRARELERELGAAEDGRIPFFSFDVHAPDIMTRGGFDVIVGNPPWVRAENLSPTRRLELRDRFRWWRSTTARGYSHQPDLSVAFLERAFQLIAPGGAIGFLLPSKLTTSDYGEVARTHLVRESTITYLHRVPERQASKFGATTYPLAVIAKVTRPDSAARINLGFGRERRMPQSRLGERGPWLLLGQNERGAIEGLLRAGTPLGEIATPALGVKTGANACFLGAQVGETATTVRVRLGLDDVELEKALVRPALRGRDVGRFRHHPTAVLVWPYDRRGSLLTALPPLALAHFTSHRRTLERRADYGRGPYWTLFRTGPLAFPFLVAWPDITRRPRATVVRADSGVIPLNSCYVCGFSSETRAWCVATVLNSKWNAALLLAFGDEARGGYRRMNARVAGLAPIPFDPKGVAILAALGKQAHADPDLDPQEIDEQVARTLRLSPGIARSIDTVLDR